MLLRGKEKRGGQLFRDLRVVAIIQRGYVSPLLGPADPAPELSEFSLVVAFMSLKVVCVWGGGVEGGRMLGF